MRYIGSFKYFCISLLSSTLLIGCGGTMPTLGGGEGNFLTGGSAGSTSENKNKDLESCDQALGTLTVFEDTSLPWWGHYRQYYKNLGSTVPVIRAMVQQSNCFVIVERGEAMKSMQRERALMNSGDLRSNSNFGQGQMVAADYTLSPSVQFKQSNMGRITGAASRLLPGGLGGRFGSGSVGSKSNEAQTTILLIDNRSGVQVSSSVGSAKNLDFSFAGMSFGGGGFAGASGFTDTAEGKVIIAAFADSYNQMVKALRKYKPQTVKGGGGLGAGGALKVDGAVDAQPKAQPQPRPQPKAKAAPAPKVTTTTNSQVNINRNRTAYISMDEIDEKAMDDYYKSLKSSIEHLGTFASWTKEQTEAMKSNANYKAMGGFGLNIIWGGPYVNRLETAQIELESWPEEARQQAWDVYGKRITRYNKIFDRHRKTIIKNQAFDESIIDQLSAIELLTEENFLNQ